MLPFPPRRNRVVFIVLLALLWLTWSSLRSQYSGATRLYRLATHSARWPCRQNSFRHVDPLIGSVNGGHVFPGATMPNGMAKASADVTGENQGGFGSDGSDVAGFSSLHDLGVGWKASLGNFPIMPITQCPDHNPHECKFLRKSRAVSYRNDSVVARPGYFGITLDGDVDVDMTVTRHTALYRFRQNESAINEKLGTVMYIGMEDLESSATSTFLSINKETGRIKGSGSFSPSFGRGRYRAHFCADFFGAGIIGAGYNELVAAYGDASGQSLDNDRALPAASNTSTGAWMQIAPGPEIIVRMGMSFISHDQACRNAKEEIPRFDFKSTLAAAEAAWEDKFAVVDIDVQGASNEMLTLFWTGIYRSLISPQDYTGENPLWNSSEPYYDSWYCIWDTFRTTHPLLTLLDPIAQTRMVRSLIDIYVHEGKMPDCRMAFSHGFTQGGSNAEVVLTDSFLKGISDGVNWTLGLEASLADANEYAENWLTEGRGGIDDWHNLGYLSIDNNTGYSRSISRTVEYGYDDFCIAELAHKLDHPLADEMLRRSHNWENLFNENITSFLPEPDTPGAVGTVSGEDTGFVGFLQPRRMNGSFTYQDPAVCSPLLEPNGCFLNARTKGETYEGSVWLYTFLSSPSDMATLVKKLGGDETFVERLDYFHESGLLYFGDEQSFLTTYLYHYAGRPALSGERVRSYIPSIFNTSLNGLPGNDDSGAMGAFTTLSMLGLFPNAGQDVYFITPPFFKSVSILNQSTGKVATISTINFDGSHGENRFIQKATINGKPWNKSWLRHRFFLDGDSLVLTLGPEESSWGTGDAARPPSTGRDGSWGFMYT